MAEVSEKMRKKLLKKKGEMKTSSGGFKTFMIKEGTTRMRPVYVGQDAEFAVEVITFYLGKDLGFVISPATFGEKCAIMEKYEELKNSKKDSNKVLASKFRPSRKQAVAHYRYNDEKGKEPDLEHGVKLLILANGLAQELIDLYLDDEAGDFTDPVTGYDIKYKRTGKTKMDTEYSLIACKPTKACQEFRKKIYNPEKMVREIMPTYEETVDMIAKFLKDPGGDSDDSSGESESTKDRLKKKKKKKTSDA